MEKAIKEVVPEFDNKPTEEAYMAVTADGDSLRIYPAKKAGEFVGAAVESNTKKGFSGEIRVIVGFDAEGKLSEIEGLTDEEISTIQNALDAAENYEEEVEVEDED